MSPPGCLHRVDRRHTWRPLQTHDVGPNITAEVRKRAAFPTLANAPILAPIQSATIDICQSCGELRQNPFTRSA